MSDEDRKDWTFFRFLFGKREEIFDEVTVKNDVENYSEIQGLREKMSVSQKDTVYDIGIRFPDFWQSRSRRGLVKSSLTFGKNHMNRHVYRMNVKGMKWSDDTLYFLGCKTILNNNLLDMSMVGGLFYKVYSDTMVGVNSRISNALDVHRVSIDIRPTLMVSNERHSMQYALHSIGSKTTLEMMYNRKAVGLPFTHFTVPSINIGGSVSLDRVSYDIGMSLADVYGIERLGVNVSGDAKCEDMALSLYFKVPHVCSKLYRSRDCVGIDLQYDVGGSKYVDRINVLMGVSNDQFNTGFFSVRFNTI